MILFKKIKIKIKKQPQQQRLWREGAGASWIRLDGLRTLPSLCATRVPPPLREHLDFAFTRITPPHIHCPRFWIFLFINLSISLKLHIKIIDNFYFKKQQPFFL